MMLAEKVKSVEALFQSLDTEIAEFKNWSGLSCAPICGKCCLKPDIHATVLEFLPLAFHAFKADPEATDLYDRVTAEAEGLCAILDSKRTSGMCGNYRYRGLICRLFGYSSRINRLNQAELITCSIIKAEQAGAYQKAAVVVQVGDRSIPMMSNYYMQLLSIDADLGKTLYPVNTAIKLAFEQVMHYYAYRDSSED